MGELLSVLTMNRSSIIVVLVIFLLIGGALAILSIRNQHKTTTKLPIPTVVIKENEFQLTSPAFGEYEMIPKKYTCDGANINPPLTISNIASGTKSLALVVDDPDAPLGTFVHWVVWNIAPGTLEIKEGVSPQAAQQGMNSAGRNGYMGPCPPARHRYFFKLYALDATIGLDGKSTDQDLVKAMSGHIIAESHLIGIYRR